MPQSTSEIVFTVGLLDVLIMGYGTTMLLSADTLNFTRSVSLLSLLLVGFGVAVLLLALGHRERVDVAKRRLLTKAGLALCGFMIIATPLSLYLSWALPIHPYFPPDSFIVDFWDMAPMTLYNLLMLTSFAAIGGLIIERAWSTQY